jgi:hypothetical protein
MTDTQIAPTSSTPKINYTDISTMSLFNSTVHYTGSLSTLENLNINAACTFIWN